ncbi:MAG: PAS domain S-box protein [Acidobacteria bacterium]|nr:PAS domain S-box protein [Acidobacteriota bacterium]
MPVKTDVNPEELRKGEERYRAFVQQSSEGIWCFDVERPILVELPEDEQIRQCYRFAYLAECNDAMARMYGMDTAAQLRGARLDDFMPETDPYNIDFLKAFIRSGYRLRDAESHEVDKDGRPKYFLNNFFGIVEDGRLLRAWGVQRDVTEARRSQEALRHSEERYRRLVEILPDAVFILVGGRFVFVNGAAANLLGARCAADLVGRLVLEIIHPDYRDAVEKRIRDLGEGKPVTGMLPRKLLRLDGTDVDVEVAACDFEYHGKPAVLAVAHDVTARLNLESQLRQSQKMEAVGRLAGGVAHDFNNLLTVITGRCNLILRGINGNAAMRQELEEVRKAGERAAALTRQLLAFSRKQALQPKVIDLNTVIEGMSKLLHRLIGEDVELVSTLAAGLRHVKADPGQIEQVVMNLAVNARDAMPGGGRLTIETSNTRLDSSRLANLPAATAGDYVMVRVSDTGKGMNDQVQSHVFEPFFTMKEKGEGTGLGLATVYGIVRQSGGHIWLESAPGKGTTFIFCLPAADEALDTEEPKESRGVLRRGTETVLVVEDEQVVRDLACDILRLSGYLVLSASSCGEARKLSAAHAGPIHLLLADVVMPHMSGPELAGCLTASRPEMKILFMSGYAREAMVHRGVLPPDSPFLQKPFAPDALSRRVREILDTPDTLP